MATKKFCYWLLAASLLLTHCQQIGKREPLPQDQTGVAPPEEIPTTEVEIVKKPEFLVKKAPKMGVILGAGGSLAFAHIGLLHELENQKVPVAAIAGIEWGSLVAASFATEDKVHGVEWKLLKLPVKQFQDSGFFRKGTTSVEIDRFSGFLSESFGKQTMQGTRLPLSCTFLTVNKEKSSLAQKGSVVSALRSCWPSPPHFELTGIAASLNGVADLARQMKSSGIELVVYVDVMQDNNLLKGQQNSPVALLWTQAKAVNPKAFKDVDEVISLSLPGQHMLSYENLRAIVRMGQLKAKSPVQELVNRYDY